MLVIIPEHVLVSSLSHIIIVPLVVSVRPLIDPSRQTAPGDP